MIYINYIKYNNYKYNYIYITFLLNPYNNW